ncbi:uncharacterized protein A4U43_C08F15870 [Asparagus officinalis]|nr:uncharacterized protein A4U43_C08F15870 [Asparagus officinalis]
MEVKNGGSASYLPRLQIGVFPHANPNYSLRRLLKQVHIHDISSLEGNSWTIPRFIPSRQLEPALLQPTDKNLPLVVAEGSEYRLLSPLSPLPPPSNPTPSGFKARVFTDLPRSLSFIPPSKLVVPRFSSSTLRFVYSSLESRRRLRDSSTPPLISSSTPPSKLVVPLGDRRPPRVIKI